jgi:hypothetical protein
VKDLSRFLSKKAHRICTDGELDLHKEVFIRGKN